MANRQNWYLKQLVDKGDMAAIESAAQGLTNAAVALLNNRGIVSGLVVSQSGVPDKHVSIAAGTVVLENGTQVTTTAPVSVDLTAFTGAAGTINLYLTPRQSSDTPIVIPDGSTINYRLYDDFAVVAQLSTTSNNPIPGTAFTGTLVGQVILGGAVATIINAYITQAAANRWLDISALYTYILALQRINRHVTVPSSPAPTFDANTALSFELILTSDAVMALAGVWNPGERMTVVLIQDGIGGHAFAWPAGMPGDIPDPAINAISTYQFKKTVDGRIVNLGGMTVNS